MPKKVAKRVNNNCKPSQSILALLGANRIKPVKKKNIMELLGAKPIKPVKMKVDADTAFAIMLALEFRKHKKFVQEGTTVARTAPTNKLHPDHPRGPVQPVIVLPRDIPHHRGFLGTDTPSTPKRIRTSRKCFAEGCTPLRCRRGWRWCFDPEELHSGRSTRNSAPIQPIVYNVSREGRIVVRFPDRS